MFSFRVKTREKIYNEYNQKFSIDKLDVKIVQEKSDLKERLF